MPVVPPDEIAEALPVPWVLWQLLSAPPGDPAAAEGPGASASGYKREKSAVNVSRLLAWCGNAPQYPAAQPGSAHRPIPLPGRQTKPSASHYRQ